MTGPLHPDGPPVGGSGASVLTLVRGSTFCLSGRDGDITDPAHGLFARDTRVVSGLRVRVDERPAAALGIVEREPTSATLLARLAPPPGRHDSVLLLERRRRLSDVLAEELTLRNYSPEPRSVRVEVAVESDFADLFAVKDGRCWDRAPAATVEALTTGPANGRLQPLLLLCPDARSDQGQGWAAGAEDEERPGVLVAASGAPQVRGAALAWQADVPPRGTWRASFELRPVFGPAGASVPAARVATHADAGATVPARPASSEPWLDAVLTRCVADLEGLRIRLPGARRPALAAGAPWFMTLFGRDSLLAGYMALPLDPDLLVGALEALAARQGTRTDPDTEEQPGKILHELRAAPESARAIGGHCYYGSVDATPLFVVMLGEARRWGADPATVERLLPHADAALEWCLTEGDADRDGFVDYRRSTPRGLLNQGWKDSFDGVSAADGRLPEYPVALCEVQAYVYRALLDRAEIAELAGDDATETRCLRAATGLREAFRERFWRSDLGHPALAVDRHGPLDALASNAAHALWAGLLDAEQAEALVAKLATPEMDSGWGLRTLATSMAAYNPMSYHNGSVWPHDTALAVAGLTAYRHVPGALALAHRLAGGLLDAAQTLDGRLPELMCGFGRGHYPVPVPYPTSCSPQAWASAAPLLLVRALLGLQPDVPAGCVTLDPALPERWGTVTLTDMTLGPARVTVEARGADATVSGLPHTWARHFC